MGLKPQASIQPTRSADAQPVTSTQQNMFLWPCSHGMHWPHTTIHKQHPKQEPSRPASHPLPSTSCRLKTSAALLATPPPARQASPLGSSAEALRACPDSVRTTALRPPLPGEPSSTLAAARAGEPPALLCCWGVLQALWWEPAGETALDAPALGDVMRMRPHAQAAPDAATAWSGVLLCCRCCCRWRGAAVAAGVLRLQGDAASFRVLPDRVAAMMDSTCSGTLPPIIMCMSVRLLGRACAMASAASLVATSRRRVTSGQLLCSSWHAASTAYTQGTAAAQLLGKDGLVMCTPWCACGLAYNGHLPGSVQLWRLQMIQSHCTTSHHTWCHQRLRLSTNAKETAVHAREPLKAASPCEPMACPVRPAGAAACSCMLLPAVRSRPAHCHWSPPLSAPAGCLRGHGMTPAAPPRLSTSHTGLS
jgi:hypothetical protein